MSEKYTARRKTVPSPNRDNPCLSLVTSSPKTLS
jgi:hypothetical protein